LHHCYRAAVQHFLHTGLYYLTEHGWMTQGSRLEHIYLFSSTVRVALRYALNSHLPRTVTFKLMIQHHPHAREERLLYSNKHANLSIALQYILMCRCGIKPGFTTLNVIRFEYSNLSLTHLGHSTEWVTFACCNSSKINFISNLFQH